MRTLFKVAAITLAVAVIAGSVGFAYTPEPSVPGGSISVRDATLTDTRTGNIYDFDLVAEEVGAGVGYATLWVRGPALSLCSAHGPHAEVNFGAPCDGDGGFCGNPPLEGIECGTAWEMAVAINECVAKIELHGYVHSDYPLVTYMGMMTLDLSLLKGRGPGDALVEVAVHTPKEDINLRGVLDGAVEMDTCP